MGDENRFECRLFPALGNKYFLRQKKPRKLQPSPIRWTPSEPSGLHLQVIGGNPIQELKTMKVCHQGQMAWCENHWRNVLKNSPFDDQKGKK
jgi:hypothetical protein